ncbi:choline transmembrane transporter [Schizosaccharomyces japonicus yFS275]|uniref:Choline transmembrane transporter n=1 Tax=Schizosaccharomyces japonicus (strain yFS275 / FY16936) TaxID=402676 RepID=B6JWI7_SCHJY|nr:choline transmembrane transporter [Schizosaccharomyces japonicus yFS275]EEB05738.2 choline transmembrane transporter [Schizosaccharomyces japonicus yFS275]
MFSDYASRFLAQSRFSSSEQLLQSSANVFNGRLNGNAELPSLQDSSLAPSPGYDLNQDTRGVESASVSWLLKHSDVGKPALTDSANVANSSRLSAFSDAVEHNRRSQNVSEMSSAVSEQHEHVHPNAAMAMDHGSRLAEEMDDLPFETFEGVQRAVPNQRCGTVYIYITTALLAYGLVTYWRTDAMFTDPNSMYNTIRNAVPFLFSRMLISVLVAVLWLGLVLTVESALLFILFATPFVFTGISVYFLTSTVKQVARDVMKQLLVMRIIGLVLFIFSIILGRFVWQRKESVSRALRIVQLANRVLVSLPQLGVFSFLFVILNNVCISIWALFFSRMFLRGLNDGNHTVLASGSWFLAALYAFALLWTIGFLSSVHRSAVSILVCQWYFYRQVESHIPTNLMVSQSFSYAFTHLYGMCSLASLLNVSTRVPLQSLPKTLRRISQLIYYLFSTTSVAFVASPFTVTYAAIYSISYQNALKALFRLDQLDLLSWRERSYRLSKLMLRATRIIMALAIGASAWLVSLRHEGVFYGYIVGLIGGLLGWFTMGPIEGGLGMIVDALMISSAIDVSSSQGDPNGAHCFEAWRLFNLAD